MRSNLIQIFVISPTFFQKLHQFIIVAMSFGELSRMSQIKDRNIYIQTDQLYEPLRNALRKSTISQSLLFSETNLSRAGRNMRSLSPAQAEIIKRNLYIPVNKELVPTRNLQKVMGKKFTAVDVNQRVKQALTPEQFTRMRHGTTQEIIYQIKDQPPRQSNLYTSRGNIPNILTNTNLRNLGESKVERFQHINRPSIVSFSPQRTRQNQSQIQINLIPQPIQSNQISFNAQPNRQSQLISSPQKIRQSQLNSSPQKIRQSQSNFSPQKKLQSQFHLSPQPNPPPTQINFNPQVLRQSKANIYTQPAYSHSQQRQSIQNIQINNNPRMSQNQRDSLILMERTNNKVSSPIGRNQSSKQILNKSMTSITAMRNDVNVNEGIFLSQAKSGTDNSSKLYDFRGSKISQKTNGISKKNKDQYKYNLFSAFDEAGNTKCRSGCFNSNQIVASKIQHNPWK